MTKIFKTVNWSLLWFTLRAFPFWRPPRRTPKAASTATSTWSSVIISNSCSKRTLESFRLKKWRVRGRPSPMAGTQKLLRRSWESTRRTLSVITGTTTNINLGSWSNFWLLQLCFGTSIAIPRTSETSTTDRPKPTARRECLRKNE